MITPMISIKTNGDRGCLVMLGTVLVALAAPMARGDGISIETDTLLYVIGPDGRSRVFTDKSTGRDYCRTDTARPFASIEVGGATHTASAVEREGDRISVTFGESGISAVLRVEEHDRYFTLEVESLEGTSDGRLSMVDIPLMLEGRLYEPFAGCAMALNLSTYVPSPPSPSDRLLAYAYDRFDFVGAKVAIIGCPMGQLRDVMKQVVLDAPDLPQTDRGGPWAMDEPTNYASYWMDVAAEFSEENIDELITLTRQLGITQLDFHAGVTMRFGDYEPGPKHFPNGKAGVKAAIDKLHDAGMKAGLHTYAFMLAKNTPWVTPVPRHDLNKKRTFTLAADIDADATEIPVVEATEGVSHITGWAVRNSNTLHVGDELITFGGVKTEPPYALIKCQRAALGTKAAGHQSGDKVHQLNECFGLFAPEPDSELFDLVVARTAEMYNDCGFDMMYLDAIDAADLFAGWNYAWHYAGQFVFKLTAAIKKPCLYEMSYFPHHCWYVRSRMGAWDVPCRGAKPFVDIHTLVNESCREMMLPSHLGWWGALDWNPIQPERILPDDMEYVCAKAIGNDSSLSILHGFSLNQYRNSEYKRRLGDIFRRYETLRLSGTTPDSVKHHLRDLGREFTLREDANGDPFFLRTRYDEHKVRGLDGWSDSWTMRNSFAEQPLQLRIEAMKSLAPYDHPDAEVLISFDDTRAWSKPGLTDGVMLRASLDPADEPSRDGARSGRMSAYYAHGKRYGIWTRFEQSHEPYVNLSNCGIGVWVYGDGKGELINIQSKSPQHRMGGVMERYIDVDFKGWRYFEFLESESDRLQEFTWPYFIRRENWRDNRHQLAGYAYPTLHYWVYLAEIEQTSLWFNRLPPFEEVACYLSPIKTLPMVDTKLLNPSVIVNGQRITFACQLEPGGFIELLDGAARQYDSQGTFVADVTQSGAVPTVQPGVNEVSFDCDGPTDVNPRANVTVITLGPRVE